MDHSLLIAKLAFLPGKPARGRNKTYPTGHPKIACQPRIFNGPLASPFDWVVALGTDQSRCWTPSTMPPNLFRGMVTFSLEGMVNTPGMKPGACSGSMLGGKKQRSRLIVAGAVCG